MSVAVEEAPRATRGTSNRDERGSSEERRKRKAWLVETYRANRDLRVLTEEDRPWPMGREIYLITPGSLVVDVPLGEGEPACRCYRCGDLLTKETVTADRIVPGCEGGTYDRWNIRPACGDCNSETGGPLAAKPKRALARACPTCGAKRFRHCVTRDGAKTRPHVARRKVTHGR
jgi:hypothetical protein